jgi:hypothetical protein
LGELFDDWDVSPKRKTAAEELLDAQKQHDREKRSRKARRKSKRHKPRRVGVNPFAERGLVAMTTPPHQEKGRVDRRDKKLPGGGTSMTCPECHQPKLKMSLWVEDGGRLICRKCHWKKHRAKGSMVTVGALFGGMERTWEFNWDKLEAERVKAGIGIQHLAAAMGVSHVTYINRRDNHVTDRVTETVARAILDEFLMMNVRTADDRSLTPDDREK